MAFSGLWWGLWWERSGGEPLTRNPDEELRTAQQRLAVTVGFLMFISVRKSKFPNRSSIQHKTIGCKEEPSYLYLVLSEIT